MSPAVDFVQLATLGRQPLHRILRKWLAQKINWIAFQKQL